MLLEILINFLDKFFISARVRNKSIIHGSESFAMEQLRRDKIVTGMEISVTDLRWNDARKGHYIPLLTGFMRILNVWGSAVK